MIALNCSESTLSYKFPPEKKTFQGAKLIASGGMLVREDSVGAVLRELFKAENICCCHQLFP